MSRSRSYCSFKRLFVFWLPVFFACFFFLILPVQLSNFGIRRKKGKGLGWRVEVVNDQKFLGAQIISISQSLLPPLSHLLPFFPDEIQSPHHTLPLPHPYPAPAQAQDNPELGAYSSQGAMLSPSTP